MKPEFDPRQCEDSEEDSYVCMHGKSGIFTCNFKNIVYFEGMFSARDHLRLIILLL